MGPAVCCRSVMSVNGMSFHGQEALRGRKLEQWARVELPAWVPYL